MKFSNSSAEMAVLEITRASFLSGVRIKDIPGSTDILKTVRLAALVRETQFLVPHGDTILVPGDKVYVAGHRDNVQAFIDCFSPDDSSSVRIFVFLKEYTGRALIREAISMGCDVSVIEKDLHQAEETIGDLPHAGLVMIHGDPTDDEILKEAGVPKADVFVSTSPVDEDNILSVNGESLGVKKCVSLSHKPGIFR